MEDYHSTARRKPNNKDYDNGIDRIDWTAKPKTTKSIELKPIGRTIEELNEELGHNKPHKGTDKPFKPLKGTKQPLN